MAGRAVAMVPSGSFGGPEHQLEGLNSNFTGILSSRGDHGAEAIGTARGRNKRKARSKNWSKEQTRELLKACLKFEEDVSTSKGRRPVRKWQIICGSVNGKSAEECEGRSETLTKSFNRIKKYCDDHHKQFDKLSTEEFKRLKLACKIEPDWYDLLFKIKEQPQNTMGVSSPDSRNRSISSSSAPEAVMNGSHDSITMEEVGTPTPTDPRGQCAPDAHLEGQYPLGYDFCEWADFFIASNERSEPEF